MAEEAFSASGFDRVDAAADAARYVEYLDAQAATPFWRERKRATIEALGLAPGMRALDVGCGTGDDVRAMAARCGDAVGVDASSVLIEEARSRGGEGVRFELARAEQLPFEDGSFDALRVERTLQHVVDLDRVLGELLRALRPGGALVALEPDWETLVIDGEPPAASRAAAARWADRIRNPVVGRELGRRLAELGAAELEVEAASSVIRDLAFAEQQFDLAVVGDDAWLAGLRERDAAGRFLAAVTYFQVSARRR